MNATIIVAAGKGTRMGPGVDKLFLEVAGLPVVGHTWQRFDAAPDVHEIILVVRDGMQGAFSELAAQLSLRKPFRLVAGGRERQDSVWQGLTALAAETALVAIQDGARPCTHPEVIHAAFNAAARHGAAVAAQPVTDTIKESADGQTIAAHLDRARLWAVQTPQTFQVGIIRRALTAVREKGVVVTDDTAACQLIGQAVHLVASAHPNPKVTVPSDLAWVNVVLQGLPSLTPPGAFQPSPPDLRGR